ncbi:hypothetical protein EDC56_2458 [Sinobacterium caligoides]|uniref:Ubiquinone biosynthesis accessory factor UbiK n=1 Tax=Sinobacterium caligoides TaxID=933926 RepID=A0A3N2DQY0_9GAMM|nr:accessory factor UbiK family protein [Sinobacterium caligoides]ROS02009.1 hypothetical protein EDC56_2458 [Sinobacterium caligoides]
MSKDQFIEELSQQVSKLISAAPQRDDLEKAVKAISQSAFSKLELVSRDEFDAQTAVLQRSRQQLEALEKQLAELSKRLP